MSMMPTSGRTIVQQFEPADAIGRVVDDVPGELEHHPQHLACVAAVFDQQHASGPRATFRQQARTLGLDVLPRRNLRQSDGERAAAPFSLARRHDRAAVQLDEAADQRQADSEAAPRAVERPIRLHVQVEDDGQQLRRDAEPGVLDVEHRVAAVGAQRRPESGRLAAVYLTALVTMLVSTCSKPHGDRRRPTRVRC